MAQVGYIRLVRRGKKACVSGPWFGQATGVPVFLIPGNNPGERSAARRTVSFCTARRRVLPSPGGAGRALPGIVATDAENAHARRRSTGGDFCPRGCSNETPDRASSPRLSPRSSGLAGHLWRALVIGPGSYPRLPE